MQAVKSTPILGTFTGLVHKPLFHNSVDKKQKPRLWRDYCCTVQTMLPFLYATTKRWYKFSITPSTWQEPSVFACKYCRDWLANLQAPDGSQLNCRTWYEHDVLEQHLQPYTPKNQGIQSPRLHECLLGVQPSPPLRARALDRLM